MNDTALSLTSGLWGNRISGDMSSGSSARDGASYTKYRERRSQTVTLKGEYDSERKACLTLDRARDLR